MRLAEALAEEGVRRKVRRALALGPLCDRCLGRLLAEIDTGLDNAERGRRARQAVGAGPAEGTCHLCRGLFDHLEPWVEKAVRALQTVQVETFLVCSHPDPALAAREQALWEAAGGDTAEPYKQEFNRLVGLRVAEATGLGVDFDRPHVQVMADHRTGEVSLLLEPLLVAGRYRKLVRHMPQCRWVKWPTSVQEIVGDPVLRAAEGEDHAFHGCGREDTDVRCLGWRPFILEVRRPRRRRLDWDALVAEINASGKVEVDALVPCRRADVARLKALRPQKTYRALVELEREAGEADLERLRSLVGVVRQRTPRRVLHRRSNRLRRRRVRALEWRPLGPRRLELTVRADAGTYIKELVSGDAGRSRPSVAEVLGMAAECVELDVLAVHVPPDWLAAGAAPRGPSEASPSEASRSPEPGPGGPAEAAEAPPG